MNMKKEFLKDSFRNIKKTFRRFLSILIMLALGTCVFVGMKMTAPNMRYAIDKLRNDQNAYDLSVENVYGLDQRDINILKNEPDIESIEGVKSIDLFSKDNKNTVFELISLTESINKVLIIKGNMPKNDNEILMGEDYLETGAKLGDTIEFDCKDSLKKENYKIVGFVKSIDFINKSHKKRTRLGSGFVDHYGYINPDNFKDENFKKILIKLKNTQNQDLKDSNYRQHTEDQKEKIQKLLDGKVSDKLSRFKNENLRKIKKYEDKINHSLKKLQDGEKKLEESQQKIDESENKYQQNKINLEKEIINAKNTLDTKSHLLQQNTLVLNEKRRTLLEKSDELTKNEKLIYKSILDINEAIEQIEQKKKTVDKNYQKIEDSLKFLDEKRNELYQNEKTLNLKVQELRIQKEKLLKSKDEFLSKKEQIQKNNSFIEWQINELSSLLNLDNSHDNKINQLNEKISKLNKDIEKVNEEIQKLDQSLNKNESIKKEIEVLKQEHADKKSNVNSINIEIAQKESDLFTLYEKLKELNNTDEEYEKVELEIKSLLDSKKELEEKLFQLKKQLNQLDDKIKYYENLLLDEKVIREKTINLKEKLEFLKRELNHKKELLLLLQNNDKEEINKKITELQNQIIDFDSKLKEFQNREAIISQSLEKIGLELQKITAGKQEIEIKRESLEENKLKLGEIYKTIYSTYDNLLNKYHELSKNEKKLYDSKNMLISGLNVLGERESELNEGKNKLLEGYNLLYLNESRYKNQLKEAREKIDKALNKIENEKEKFYKNYNKNLKKINDGKRKINEQKEEIDKLKKQSYHVNSIADSQYVKIFSESADNIQTLSNIFPPIFYLISLIVAVTTMTRLVDKDRRKIGTYKALGYDNWTIASKYVIYSAFAAIPALILGIFFAMKVLMPVIYNAYYSDTIFTKNYGVINIYYLIVAFFINIVLTTYAALSSVSGVLKENAACLFRNKEMKHADKFNFSNNGLLSRNLSFFSKVSLRNIFCYKKRLFMTVIGVCGCSAFITMGFGIKDSVVGVSHKQFNEILHYDMVSVYNNKADKKSLREYDDLLNTDKNIKDSLDVYQDLMSFTNKKNNHEDITLCAIKDSSKIPEFITLRDLKTGKNYDINDKKVVISYNVSKITGKNVGDYLKIYDSNFNEYSFKIGAVCENYFGHYIYVSQDEFERQFRKNFNAKLITLNDKNDTNLNEKLNELTASVQTFNNKDNESYMKRFVKSLNTVVFIIVVISSILAIVILYNLTNINIEERIRELSTIKVLGFYPFEITKYIYRENIVLTFVGIFFGFFAGKILHMIIIKSIAPSVLMLQPGLKSINYLISFALTILFSLIIMGLMHIKLLKIDMVESLKANE